MRRVDAWRIVATVQYVAAVGDRAVMDRVRDAMRLYDTTSFVVETPITVMIRKAGPLPAFISTPTDWYEAPEANSDRGW